MVKVTQVFLQCIFNPIIHNKFLRILQKLFSHTPNARKLINRLVFSFDGKQMRSFRRVLQRHLTFANLAAPPHFVIPCTLCDCSVTQSTWHTTFLYLFQSSINYFINLLMLCIGSICHSQLDLWLHGLNFCQTGHQTVTCAPQDCCEYTLS